ncbi:MAG: hypothetical protein FJ255_13000 [Phycisphaerae bacterium]|nr:hypothetical protein [Phycisphaerae bacterium]
MTDLPTRTVPDFDDVLAQLEHLARTHLLLFRVEVGRTLAEAFYGGDVDRYRTRSADGALKDFLAERAGPLADLGLHPQLIRQSLLAWDVVADLPEDVRPRLIYAHVLELARVDDRATRRLLAQAALDNGWTGKALRGAVDATRSGRWIDVDPAPGLQPPPPEEPVDAPKKVAVGWALKRAERTVSDFAAVADELGQVDVAALSEKQRVRALAAVEELRQRVERLQARLSGR